MSFAVYGATGYTGRLVAAELAARGLPVVVCGRNPQRLSELAATLGGADVDVAVAAADDPAALEQAFRGRASVVNCAGPFTTTGPTVVGAAIASGCHYVDTSGEQHFLHQVFDGFDATASTAGVTVAPAMAADGAPGDLLAHLVGTPIAPLAELHIAYWLSEFGLSRGSLRSALEAQSSPEVVFRDRAWVRAPRRTRRGRRRFPGGGTDEVMMRLAGAEVITVPRHLAVDAVEVSVNATAMAPGRAAARVLPSVSPLVGPMLRTPLKRALTAALGLVREGPSEQARRAASAVIVVEARARDGRTATGHMVGADIYGNTAVIAAEAAVRLAAGGAPVGVRAPAEVVDPAGFLSWLEPHGYHATLPGDPPRPGTGLQIERPGRAAAEDAS